MNLDMIRPKNDTEDSLRLLNTLIEKQKKHWNIYLQNQAKHFNLIHLYRLKDLGLLV